MTSVFTGKFYATNNSEDSNYNSAQLSKMAGEEALLGPFNESTSTSTDSRYIFAKEKEFRSEDAINVSADAEDATECCNPGNSKPKQHCRMSTGLSKAAVLVRTSRCKSLLIFTKIICGASTSEWTSNGSGGIVKRRKNWEVLCNSSAMFTSIEGFVFEKTTRRAPGK